MPSNAPAKSKERLFVICPFFHAAFISTFIVQQSEQAFLTRVFFLLYIQLQIKLGYLLKFFINKGYITTMCDT